MQSLSQALVSRLSYPRSSVPESVLHPGQERQQLLEFLLARLVQPASLASLLSRLELPEQEKKEHLPEDELLAHRESCQGDWSQVVGHACPSPT